MNDQSGSHQPIKSQVLRQAAPAVTGKARERLSTLYPAEVPGDSLRKGQAGTFSTMASSQRARADSTAAAEEGGCWNRVQHRSSSWLC